MKYFSEKKKKRKKKIWTLKLKWFTLTNNFFYLKCIEFPSPTPTQSTTRSPNSLGFHFFFFLFFTSTQLAYNCSPLVFHYKFIFFNSLFHLHTFCFEVLSLASWLTTFLLSSECTKTKKRDRHTLRNKWRRWRGCRNRGRRNKGKEEEMRSRDKYEEEEEKPR